MNPTLNAPIDDLHRDCLEAVHDVRADVTLLKKLAEHWHPRPMPADYDRKEKP